MVTNASPARGALRAAVDLLLVGMLLLQLLIAGLQVLPDHARWVQAFLLRLSAPGTLGSYYRDQPQRMLDWVSRETPVRSTVLILDRETDPLWWMALHYRAAYYLYPRRVWWGTPAKLNRAWDWRVEIPLRRELFLSNLSEYRVQYLVVNAIPRGELALPEGSEIVVLGDLSPWYMVKLPRLAGGK